MITSTTTAVVILLFFLYSASLSIKEDGKYYDLRESAEPPIVTEFYRYFASHPVKGAILTSDPVPAAYADSLFIPYYYSMDEASELYDAWIEKDAVSAIIFNPSSFPCLAGDSACESAKRAFIERVNQNKEVFSKEYDGTKYLIYYSERSNHGNYRESSIVSRSETLHSP